MQIDVGSARALAEDLLRAAGMAGAPASRTAWALVAADATGRASHGLLRLPYYLDRFAAGGCDARAELRVLRRTAVTAVLDGGNGLGHHQVYEAATMATEMALDHGISAVSVSNSGHCGALGLYLQPMLDAGLVGIALSTGPAVLPPPGGTRAVLSTSPLAAGVPVRPRPIVVDMALSAVARGRIAEHASAGAPIPEGWAFDAAGRPTTDPSVALSGLLAPLGGAKGFALALLVESLTAGVVGPNLATSIADPLAPAAAGAPQRIAHLVLAIDPACLDPDGSSPERLARLATSVAGAGGRLPGAGRPLVADIAPGDRLALADEVASALSRRAAALGVELPEPFRAP